MSSPSMPLERIFQAMSNRRTQNNGPVCCDSRTTKPLFRVSGFPGNGLVVDPAIGHPSRSIVKARIALKNRGVIGMAETK
jgi:hypothetical protein